MTPEWLRTRYNALKSSETSRPASATSRSSNDAPKQSLQDLTSLEAFEQKMTAITGIVCKPILRSPAGAPPQTAPAALAFEEIGSKQTALPLTQLPPPPDFAPPMCPEL